MESRSYILSKNTELTISPDHADKLLHMGDGTCALLYLYALRKAEGFLPSQAAVDLKRTRGEIETAAERLRQAGLFSDGRRGALPAPSEELPQYQAEEIVSRSAEDNVFPVVLEETQRILGKTLSRTDVDVLFGIYDYLGLPPEVIILLVNHCLETTRRRLGSGRLPSMRTIEKEAYVWFNKEILTLEQAEEYLSAKQRRTDAVGEVKSVLQINGRSFSPTERAYVESWLDMGFDLETIALAYDKTVVKTGALHWKYMNSILSSWHAKDLHTVERVEKGDRRDAVSPDKDDSELLKKLLSKSSGK